MTTPRTLGRYRILERLGAGAMGEVYLAEDPQIERQVAIKTVRLAGVDGSEIDNRRDRLLREAKAVGRLIHPNVVTLFDAGEENGVLFLALEYVPGTDLRDRMKSEPKLTIRQVLALVEQTASALGVAHRQGIIHRDVKPGNILLNEQGEAKISDFGIAKVQDQISDLTASGAIIGTPFYMSPEQIRGETIDGRADLFSLGAVLFELLHGARPFEGDTITTVVYQILHHDPLPAVRGDLPAGIARLLESMLAKDVSQRVETAEAVVESISELERNLPVSVLEATALGAPLPTTPVVTDQPPTPPPPPPAPASSQLPPAPPAPASSPAASGSEAPTPKALTGSAAGVRRRIHPAAIAAIGCLAVAFVGVVIALLIVAPRVRAALRDAASDTPTEIANNGTAKAHETTASMPRRPGEDVPEAGEPAPTELEEASTGPTPAPLETDRTPAGAQPADDRVTSDRVSDQPPARASTTPPPSSARPTEAPPRTATRTTPRPTTGAKTTAEPERLAESERPAAAESVPEDTQLDDSVRWQSEVRCGPEIALMVVPEDAYVQLRGPGDDRFTSIGQARDFDIRRKRARAFRMPGEGVYFLRLRREGYPDHTVRLEVSPATAGTTPVAIQLGAGKVRQLPQAITVKQGVTFSGGANDARVLVDGTVRGTVGRFRARALRLTRGRHRLVIVDGGDRLEMLVVVSPGARLRNGVVQIPE